MKHPILLFFAMAIAPLSFAQKAGYTDDAALKNTYKEQISGQVQQQMAKIDWTQVNRATNGNAVLYTVPVVVHILHNYGQELVTDVTINTLISRMNSYFLKSTPDTAQIIDKFRPVAANTQIAFRLATVAPDGRQTKGIEHIPTYLTYGNSNYEDQLKTGQWPQARYLNIWIINSVYYSGGINVYPGFATSSFDAAYSPYYDGIVIPYTLLTAGYAAKLAAKYLNLPEPCSSNASGICYDEDMIPDTPPCNGTYYTCANVYSTTCDTPNVQNIMVNRDTCGIMFTYGQGQYMQYILQISIGNRDSLITPQNFVATGIGQPVPDMLPVPDFSVSSATGALAAPPKKFYVQGQPVVFKNYSWNDTITSVAWAFPASASVSSSTSLTTVVNHFHQPGWVTVSLAATGNNSGTATSTDDRAVYMADSIATPAAGYIQDFPERGDAYGWPMFNYYNNNFMWQLAAVGCYDHTSLEYAGYDGRPVPQNKAGTPQGDIDDVFTPGFDLTGFGDSCYLNFMSSGAARTAIARNMNDSLVIAYSANGGLAWVPLMVYKGSQLANKGMVTAPYTPAMVADWVSRSISLPQGARTAYTLFRLRYHPGADSAGSSTGNNFYLDHFNFNVFPESVATLSRMNEGISVQPNPTYGSASVTVKDNTGLSSVMLTVTDVTGKEVYRVIRVLRGNTGEVEIPANALRAKGLYLLHVTTNKFNRTEKLIVY